MPALKPVTVLVNAPAPVPTTIVLRLPTLGTSDVLQQTPRAVTGAPPSLVTAPPQRAVLIPVVTGTAVVTVGRVMNFA